MRGIPVSELVAMIERGTKSEPAPLIEEIGIGEVAYGLAKTARRAGGKERKPHELVDMGFDWPRVGALRLRAGIERLCGARERYFDSVNRAVVERRRPAATLERGVGLNMVREMDVLRKYRES